MIYRMYGASTIHEVGIVGIPMNQSVESNDRGFRALLYRFYCLSTAEMTEDRTLLVVCISRPFFMVKKKGISQKSLISGVGEFSYVFKFPQIRAVVGF